MMKRALILFLLLSLLLGACAREPQPTKPTGPTEPVSAQATGSPTTDPTQKPTIVPTDAPTEEPTQPKTLLELQYFELDETVSEGTEAETEAVSVLLEDLVLPETELKPYEKESFLAPVAAALETELGLTLDSRWKFYIHYYTQEQNIGVLVLTYWIDGVIATNRAVTVPIENGAAATVIHSYLNSPLDENALLERYANFLRTHVQQKGNVLGEAFEIYAESTLYSYNFRTDTLMYTYNIFYRHIETGIIDNSHGTELVIE